MVMLYSMNDIHHFQLNCLKTKNVLNQQNKEFQKKMTTFLHSIQQKCQFWDRYFIFHNWNVQKFPKKEKHWKCIKLLARFNVCKFVNNGNGLLNARQPSFPIEFAQNKKMYCVIKIKIFKKMTTFLHSIEQKCQFWDQYLFFLLLKCQKNSQKQKNIENV